MKQGYVSWIYDRNEVLDLPPIPDNVKINKERKFNVNKGKG